MRKTALIVAGGKGARMNSSIPKQFLLLNNIPILIHTINAFSDLDEILLVLPKEQFNYWNQLCLKYNLNIPHTIIAGGESRFDSVKNGLDEICNESIVLIHDGVRPFISKKIIAKLINTVKKKVGVVPVIKLKDSIRKISNDSTKPISRKDLYKIQTPQCFLSTEIKTAYQQVSSKEFTDDASVFESISGTILPIMGEERNLKITTKEDLEIANSLI